MPGAGPVAKSPYRMLSEELDELKKQLKEFLEQGFVRLSASPWGSPVLFVEKNDGTKRMCIDYRTLNSMMIKNKYPLPRIEDLLDRLKKATFFSKIDLRSGYHQMKIREQDFPKMTFTTSEWFVQVCGSFIRADQRPCRLHDPNEQSICGGVGQVRGGVHRRYPNFLIDRRGHEEYLRIVLERLKQQKLYAKFSKCEFWMGKVAILGHVLSPWIHPKWSRLQNGSNR
jgi:hypothetical protein